MPKTDIFIRPANLSDLATIQKLGCETYADHFSFLWSPEGLKNFLAQDFSVEALEMILSHPNKHQWLIAYYSSDLPVGLSKANWSQPNPITNILGAELQKIYLLKSFSGVGAGTELLKTTVKNAILRGESSIWLDVLKTNTKAQKFYSRVGFIQVGEIPFKTDLKEIGMTVMACDLRQA
ncbi:GNAT family N-acetyltransferase [Pseudomonas sp.]|uniref:GNAT family N-acetyltransferase n=1 Tax=Pseudomonas sp. TaxID=306 RepID=UPI003C7399A0